MKAPSIAAAVNTDRITHSSRYPTMLRRRTAEAASLMAEWNRRRAYRADLKRLLSVGRYMIRDIGLTPEEALYESRKPFWKP